MTSSAAVSVRRWHRPLMLEAGLMAALAVFCLAAMFFDARQLFGESVWLKPLKFAIAFALYSVTLAWLLSLPHRWSRVTRALGAVFAATGVIDVGFIVVMAARGTFSHFNTDHADKVNDIGQWLFATGVPGLFFANLLIAVIVSWQRVADRPTSRAIHFGLAISVFGMALGYLMVGTGRQLTHDTAGRPVELAAGHTVLPGVTVDRDALAGMPITHWSTVGGDMRIPHFAGLHGIQILLLAAFGLGLLARRRPWLTERVRARVIGVLGLGYFGLVALLLWQALRAQSLIHPDGRTLWAFAGLAAVVVVGVGGVVVAGRPSTASRPRKREAALREREAALRERKTDTRNKGTAPQDNGPGPQDKAAALRDKRTAPRDKGTAPRDNGTDRKALAR